MVRTGQISPAQGAAGVPLGFEERLQAARDILGREIDNVPIIRTTLSHYNDIVYHHSHILRSLNENFLR
jgi:hypothetical protein